MARTVIHDGFTVYEGVTCLEEPLGRSDNNKLLNVDDSIPDTSVGATLTLTAARARGWELYLDLAYLDFSGVPHVVAVATDGPRGDAARVPD